MAAVCFILPDGRHLTCVGECPGSVAFARLAGDYGFGYDPLFIPTDCGVGKTGRRPNTEGRIHLACLCLGIGRKRGHYLGGLERISANFDGIVYGQHRKKCECRHQQQP